MEIGCAIQHGCIMDIDHLCRALAAIALLHCECVVLQLVQHMLQRSQ